MSDFPINWLAILVAVIVKQALGALWFSPVLFFKQWSVLTGVTDSEMKTILPKALIPDIVGALIMAIVLDHAVHYAGARTVTQGAAVGLFSWLGFIAVATIGSVTFERRPFKLYLINNGVILLALLIMGAILAAWP